MYLYVIKWTDMDIRKLVLAAEVYVIYRYVEHLFKWVGCKYDWDLKTENALLV